MHAADDARLTFENVLDAGLHGATVANYVLVEGLAKNTDRIVAARVRNVINDAAIRSSRAPLRQRRRAMGR